jgi:hypothetical protein
MLLISSTGNENPKEKQFCEREGLELYLRPLLSGWRTDRAMGVATTALWLCPNKHCTRIPLLVSLATYLPFLAKVVTLVLQKRVAAFGSRLVHMYPYSLRIQPLAPPVYNPAQPAFGNGDSILRNCC